MKRNIQLEGSKHLSYLSDSTIDNYKDKLIYIQNTIMEQLKDYPNFNGVSFSDVSAGGIQIEGHHMKINGYHYGDSPTIEYDFSNAEECIKIFVDGWKKIDNPDDYNSFIKFIEDGEKYGWD